MSESSAQTLKAAVVGTGKISEEHLRFLLGRSSVRLVGVCDLSPSLAKYAATKFGVAGAFTDFRSMLREANPDVVHVLTPPHTHVGIVSECLAVGSHVIVEKPAAPSVREAVDLWALADRHGRTLVENHNYRFNEPIRRMTEAVRSGHIGEVREVEVRMCLNIRAKGGRYADENLPHPSHRLPAGVLHEFLTHLCYVTLAFMPAWERVVPTWSNHGGGSLFKYDDLDATLLGDNVHARIRFSCAQAPDCFAVTVRGSRGWMATDLFQPHLTVNVPRRVGTLLSPLANQIIAGAGLVRTGVRGFLSKVLQVTPYEGLATFLSHTYDAIEGGAQPPVTRTDSLEAARLIEAMLGTERVA